MTAASSLDEDGTVLWGVKKMDVVNLGNFKRFNSLEGVSFKKT